MVNKCYSNEDAKKINERKDSIKGWSERAFIKIKSDLEELAFNKEIDEINKEYDFD